MENNIPRVKIVLVGAYNSGKTTYNSFIQLFLFIKRELKHQSPFQLLIRYLEQKMDYEGYIPPIFDTSEVTVNIENIKVQKLNCGTQREKNKEEVSGDHWVTLKLTSFSYAIPLLFLMSLSLSNALNFSLKKLKVFFLNSFSCNF